MKLKARISFDELRIRKIIRGLCGEYKLEMELRVLDGSEESVIIARSKMEACTEIIDRLEAVRP